MRSIGGAAMAREELVEVNDRFCDPRIIRLWHFGHWIVNRDDKGQDSLEAISRTVRLRQYEHKPCH